MRTFYDFFIPFLSGLVHDIEILCFVTANIVTNKWSRFVLVIWIFVAYTLMQSYTAKLSSIFTVNQLNFPLSKEDYVGFQHTSFVKDFLITDLGLKASKLRNYSRIEEFHEAMSRGSRKGGIDVIFGEIPYMKLFINRYGSEYRMRGPTYKPDGFGFVSFFFLHSSLQTKSTWVKIDSGFLHIYSGISHGKSTG